MAQVRFTFENREFVQAFDRMKITPQRRAGIMRAIATGLLHTTRDRFDTGTEPNGSPWRPLLPAYASVRRPGRLLVQQGDAGGLLGSITSKASGDRVIVGSNKVYAAVHQFGATIKPVHAKALSFVLDSGRVSRKSVTIPARPYLGFGTADEAEVLDVLDALLPGGR